MFCERVGCEVPYDKGGVSPPLTPGLWKSRNVLPCVRPSPYQCPSYNEVNSFEVLRD